MLKSMTAYGRASFHSRAGHFALEIQSVNRKHLEIHTSLPKELARFDSEIKKWIQPHVSRGQITVKLSVAFDETVPIVVHPNIPLARQLKQAWDRLAKELDIQESFHLALLKEAEDLFTFEENSQDEELYQQSLKKTVEIAIEGFLRMKIHEGSVLQADILARLQKMRKWMLAIEQRTPYATRKFRERLTSRLEELLPGNIENEERVLREIAIYAEKIDIAEEITRFLCHLTHFEELTQTNQGGVGKTLEFVVQELNREVNTVGSKSSDLEVARYVIDIKTELERVREQIQNIE
jgi:uncharacterized protein (TIGR00255 family)